MAYQQPIDIISVKPMPMVPVGFMGHAMLPFGIQKDWMACDGSVLQEIDYPELYEVIGTRYGTTGPGTFKLPDIMPMGVADCACGHNYLTHLRNTEHVCEMGCEEFIEDNLEWLVRHK